jgi:hypothetical protein
MKGRPGMKGIEQRIPFIPGIPFIAASRRSRALREPVTVVVEALTGGAERLYLSTNTTDGSTG